ncbi:MAG: SRPBCC family protein, partial [Lysobacterales bacterium]
MIRPVLYSTLAVVLVFLGGALLLPSEVRFERSVTIDRPVSTVFTVLERPEYVALWLPRLADEKTRVTFDGPRSGPGAVLDWSGKMRKTGTGRLEIVHSAPFKAVTARVGVKGEGEGVVELDFQRIVAGTLVTARVSANLDNEKGFMGRMVARWFGLLFERWAAPGLEHYLAGAKRHTETLPPADFAGLEVSLLKVEPVDVLLATVAEDGPAEAYRRIAVFMAEQDIERSGEPMRVSYLSDNAIVRVDALVPVRR